MTPFLPLTTLSWTAGMDTTVEALMGAENLEPKVSSSGVSLGI
jgi:hypothetical protein